MLLGDLGELPLSVKIKSRLIGYWNKILNSKVDKINHVIYSVAYKLYCNDVLKLPWLKGVFNMLDSLGLTYCWLNNVAKPIDSFKLLIKTKLKDQYIQNWQSEINSSNKCFNYRMYKDKFAFEDYFDILPPSLSLTLFKYRCCNHKMPIEKGRFFNIPRNERLCRFCNSGQLGDEFHFMFQCVHFSTDRKKYLSNYYTKHPNALKFSSLMNSKNKGTLLKLANFCKLILKCFND